MVSRRKQLKYTQQKLSDLSGVKLRTIQNYENGQSPKSENVVAIAEALECSLDWLLLGRGEPDPKQPQTAPTKPIEIEILRQVIEGVQDGLNELDSELEPEKLADLIILLYEHYAETEKKVEKETVSKYLRLVA